MMNLTDKLNNNNNINNHYGTWKSLLSFNNEVQIKYLQQVAFEMKIMKSLET